MPEKNDADKEKETPSDSSTGEKTSEDSTSDGSEPDKTPKEEELGSGIKNYDERFKTVYKNWKEAERKLGEVSSKEDAGEREEKTDTWNPSTWDEVYEQFEKRSEEKRKGEEERQKAVEEKITQDITAIKKQNPDLDEDKVWQFMADNELINVYEAVFQMQSPGGNEPNKKASLKIGSPSRGSSDKPEMTYEQLHKKDWEDIQLSE